MKHTKAIQGKDNHAKAIQALNEEQIRMRKAVIQNQMALDMLTAAQGGICAIIKVDKFEYFCCKLSSSIISIFIGSYFLPPPFGFKYYVSKLRNFFFKL